MSYSLEFVQQIAKNPLRSNFGDRDWDNANEYDSSVLFHKDEISLKRIITKPDGSLNSCDIKIKIDKDGDFQYCVSDSCLSDGTLLHLQMLLDNIYRKIIWGQSFYAPLGVPENPSLISYTVGNYVVLTEYNKKFAPESKPWLTERITIMLPVKVEFE
ncbi:MAG: hypothetical protein IJV31_00615 [Clostridia bacterium]|nr:hypothetical protein [Clostridia bacterium]